MVKFPCDSFPSGGADEHSFTRRANLGLRNCEAETMKENHNNSKLGWTVEELARSLGVSAPFLRLEIKRGRLQAAHLGRRVVLLDVEVQKYLADASRRVA